MRRASAVLILGHLSLVGWMLGAERGADPLESSEERALDASLAGLRARIDASRADALALVARGASRASASDSGTMRQPALEPAGARLGGRPEQVYALLERIDALEHELTRRAWSSFVAWAALRPSVSAPSSPTPATTVELARCARWSCSTALAYRHPHGPAYARALAELRAELLANSEHLPLRLFALKLLRRLGPREESDGQVVFVSLAGNETLHGDALVPDAAIEGLIQVGRQHPELRAELHQALWGVRHPALLAELKEALLDPRLGVRESALLHLAEHPQDAELHTLLRAARDREPDPALRRRLSSVLAGGHRRPR